MEKYTKNGDEVLNRFTDAVVEDFKSNITVDGGFDIYGGTSFMEYFNNERIGKLEYPIILVEDSSRYNTNYLEYYNENKEGEKVSHHYSTKAYPIDYGIIVDVYSKDKKQIDVIKDKIINNYSAEKSIRVGDVNYNDENIIIKLLVNQSVDNPIETIKEDNETTYKKRIMFKLFPSVYYYKNYDKECLEDNVRLQFRQLQQAQFCLLEIGIINNNILKPISKDLKPLLEQPKQTSLLGSIGSLIKDNVFVSAEYKQLKDSFANHQPLDKDLFNKVFEKTVKYYPDLFDRVNAGWSIGDIKKEFENQREWYSKLYTSICDNLQLPMTIKGYVEGSGRNNNALVFYVNEMAKKPTRSLDTVVKLYEKKLEQDRIAREEERARREEERMMQGQSGGSVAGDVLKIATGVAIGNKLSGKGKKKDNGKVDYWGTPYCQFRRKGCNFTCPLKDKCSHY